MKRLFCIFPTDLYDHIRRYIEKNKYYDIMLIEEPIYFDRSDAKTNDMSLYFNPLKPIYHRATMRCYWDDVLSRLKSKYIRIQYIEFHENWIDIVQKNIDVYEEIILFDPVDRTLERKIHTNFKHLHILDSPRFYMTREEIRSYDGVLRNQSFYNWVRRSKNIFMDNDRPVGGKMSYDQENRKKPYKGMESDVPLDTTYYRGGVKKYVDQAVKYVVGHIPYKKVSINCTEKVYIGAKTLDDLNLCLLFPINHRGSKKVLKDFFKHKILFFGDYQDIILNTDHALLYHSGISPMLNIGLIRPEEIISMVGSYYNGLSTVEKKKQLHNIEGFVRQIIGWREFCRLMYCSHYDEMVGMNFFSQTNRLDGRWYDGTTGMQPVDRCIVRAFRNGYLHHIERLMVMGNIMVLTQIAPIEMYRWFMEFSLDSYDWVMYYNVYCMASYSCGAFVSKPYISSSRYIIRMSNYKRDDQWDAEWDKLFWNFLKKHQEKFKKIPRLGMLLRNLKK